MKACLYLSNLILSTETSMKRLSFSQINMLKVSQKLINLTKLRILSSLLMPSRDLMTAHGRRNLLGPQCEGRNRAQNTEVAMHSSHNPTLTRLPLKQQKVNSTGQNQAIECELDSLISNITWEILERPKTRTNKCDIKGKIQNYKARLVACGFFPTQRH